MLSQSNSALMSDSDDERYEQELEKKKTGGRDKTLGGRGATIGRAESKKRGEGGREKETGGGTEKTSGRGRRAEESRRERDTEKRRRMPERSGTLIRGGLRRRYGTTMAQKLDKDFFAFESSFRQGHEFDRLSASDQEATYPIFASRNSGGASIT